MVNEEVRELVRTLSWPSFHLDSKGNVDEWNDRYGANCVFEIWDIAMMPPNLVLILRSIASSSGYRAESVVGKHYNQACLVVLANFVGLSA